MGTNRWKKYKIELLPIKKISTEEQQQFIELVDKVIMLQKNNQEATSVETKIDQLVYQLYNLTPEEIQIVESSIK